MATYYFGRKEVAFFTVPLDNRRSSLSCTIYEQWEDTDNTTTARCGDPGVIELKKVVGFSERDIAALTATVEGAIGVEGIVQIKSTIESAMQKEICWNVETSTSKTSTFVSPRCGRKTMFVYQLVRDFEFAFQRRNWGITKSWERKIRERTNIHDFMPDIEEYDERCGCPTPPESRKYDGVLVIDMGHISMRAPYTKTPEGIDVFLETSRLKIAINNAEDFPVRIPSAALPEIVVFLGDISETEVEARFYDYQAPITMQIDPSFHLREGMQLSIDDAPTVEVLRYFTQLDQT